jgi:hypothetical protein
MSPTRYGSRPFARGLAVPAVLELVGQAPKRGIIPRLPSAAALLDDVEAWLVAGGAPGLRSTSRQTDALGAPELIVALHPAAEPIVFSATDAGHLTVRASTLAIGAGYHTYVFRLLERLSEELGISWSASEPASASRPHPTELEVPPNGDRAAAESASLTWLRAHLLAAAEAIRLGARGVHLGLRPGTRFDVDEALATVLGPRDAAWLERALREPRVAIDVMPWWIDALGARHHLDRALTLMWSEVRWRAAADDAERAVHDEVLAELAHAFRLEPSLPFPWTEWVELLDLRGVDDGPAHDIRERGVASLAAGAPRPPIGYRRRPVTIVHEGWTLVVPGSFGERRTAEEWSGGEGGRSITIAATRTAGEDGRPLSADRFLLQVATDLGPEALEHRTGDVVGRARLSEDGSSGVAVGVLDGYAAVTGQGAAIRIVFDDPGDWQWALDMWRALRPA